MKSKKGFTLVELLVVIAIIGILSSVVMVSLNSSRAKARDAKRVSDIKQIQLALALYQDVNAAYPTEISLATLGSYMPTIPKDPSNAVAYSYAYQTVSGRVVNYHLGASMETNSPVLQDDKDQVTAPPTGGWTNPLVGTDSVPCKATDAGVKCFDVTP